MQVVSPSCRLDIPKDVLQDAGTVAAIAEDAVERIRKHGVALMKIGALRLDATDSFGVVRSILDAVRDRLVATGAPSTLAIEVDKLEGTMVRSGALTRDRVPHNDSQKTTFLTPSTIEAPAFDPQCRFLTGKSLGTHKPYASIFIHDPGDGLSITTFYDTIPMVHDAFQHQHRRAPLSVAELAEWQGANVRAAKLRQQKHGLPYITLGGLLSPQPETAWEAVSYCTTACHVEEEALRVFPTLEALRKSCPCGSCAGEAERFVCRMTSHALGISWPETRLRYERCMNSERFDLIMWNNISTLHGAIAGGEDRMLRPVYFSIPEPLGDEYEHWLSQQWQTAFKSLPAPGVADRVARVPTSMT